MFGSALWVGKDSQTNILDQDVECSAALLTCSSACSWFRWWPSDHRAGTCYDHLIFPQGRSEYFLLHVRLQCQPKLSQCFSQPTQVPHHHWLQHRKLYKAGCNPIQVKPLCGWRCQSQTCHDMTPSRFARHHQTAAAQCCGGNYMKKVNLEKVEKAKFSQRCASSLTDLVWFLHGGNVSNLRCMRVSLTRIPPLEVRCLNRSWTCKSRKWRNRKESCFDCRHQWLHITFTRQIFFCGCEGLFSCLAFHLLVFWEHIKSKWFLSPVDQLNGLRRK